MQRFWDKVNKTDGCWLWTASLNRNKYGQFKLFDHGSGKQKVVEAHKFSWQLYFGEVPSGLQVCHICDIRHCVRPDHLFLGTNKDNAQDMARKNRASKFLCKHSDEEVVLLRELYALGFSGNRIARVLEIPRGTVMSILRGDHYKFSGGPIRDRGIRYWKNRFSSGTCRVQI